MHLFLCVLGGMRRDLRGAEERIGFDFVILLVLTGSKSNLLDQKQYYKIKLNPSFSSAPC